MENCHLIKLDSQLWWKANRSFPNHITHVRHLFSNTQGLWNSHLIKECYDPQVAREILNSLISPLGREGQLVWTAHYLGFYLVKSAYNLLVNESISPHSVQNFNWKALWQLPLPQKDNFPLENIE